MRLPINELFAHANGYMGGLGIESIDIEQIDNLSAFITMMAAVILSFTITFK